MDEAEPEQHPQQAKGDASLPGVEQSKARHDEDAEEGPTNHSPPPSSPSLDKGREEADGAALTPEGEGGAPDGEESSAAGLTAEQQQLLSMLNSIVVENDDEEEREEEGKSEEEDGGKDGDVGKEVEEKQDLVDLVEEELGEEDMELETEEKEKHLELVEDSCCLLQAKKEAKEEGDGGQSESENGGEEEQRNPDAQSARLGDTPATEDEWLAQLPSFVAPYAQRTSQRIDQRIERLRIVEEEIRALSQFDDALAYFRTQRGELMEQLKQRKERFAQFIANPQVSAVALDEKWRQTFPWTESIRDTLSRVYQFRRFRPMQEEAINAALSGEDVFVLFATGAGKSLCYELPALYANGVTVVISPLKSLMNDQFNHLVSRFTRKIAKPLHGDLSSAQRDDILRELRGGAATSRLQLKLCYVAPETFFQPYAQEVFKKLHDKGLLSRFVVDEAHVVHEWEHFRPQYMNLSRLREKFPHVPITTTTATAPPPVIEKVCENLQLHDPIFCINNPPRRELSLSVIDRTDGEQQLIEWIKANWPDGCGIVYALTIKMVESLCKALQKAGIAAGKYFKDAHNKEYTHDQWMADELKVIVATSAFGMGIDKPDVRYVVFYNLPQSMVQFHQGVGRAGRDGQRADGVIFWSYREDKREILNLQQRPGDNQPDKATCETALNTLIRYCQNTSVCRMGAMMEYLSTYTFSGEQTLYRCTGPTDTEGICDNCRGYRESDEEESAAQDLAREVARAILRIAKYVTDQANEVGGTGPISNVTTLVDIFCGSMKGYIRKAGFHLIDDYGKARRMVYDPPTSEFVCDLVKQMLQKGILCEDSLHGRTFISPGEHEARLETTRFRTTCQATKESRTMTKKSTTASSGGGGKPSKSDKGKEKVTDLDDFDEAEPRPEEEREKRKKKRNKEEEEKKKSKTTTTTKKRAHSPSDLGMEADHSDEPRLKRRRTSEPAAESGRSTTSTSTSSSSSSAPTRPRKQPRPRAAKVAASKALVKKEPEYPVEAVVDECTRREKVCVKWEGYGHDQNTWERKKGFVATAPMPYRDFLRRMQLEGRTITRDGPCECRLCREQRKLKLAKTVKNENSKKNDDDDNSDKKNDNDNEKNKNEDNKEKNKKRRKRYSEVSSSDESSAGDQDSDSYEQDDDSDAVAERAWKSRNARAVRAEARAELVVIDDDDDEDDNNSDTGIDEDGGEDELLRSPSPPKR